MEMGKLTKTQATELVGIFNFFFKVKVIKFFIKVRIRT